MCSSKIKDVYFGELAATGLCVVFGSYGTEKL